MSDRIYTAAEERRRFAGDAYAAAGGTLAGEAKSDIPALRASIESLADVTDRIERLPVGLEKRLEFVLHATPDKRTERDAPPGSQGGGPGAATAADVVFWLAQRQRAALDRIEALLERLQV